MQVIEDKELELREFFEFIIKARRLLRKGWVPNTAYRAIVEIFSEMLKEG